VKDKSYSTGLIIIFVIFLVVFSLYFEIKINKLDSSLPHKYCHNETERINVSCNDFISIHIYEYVKPELYPDIKAESIIYKNVSKEEMDVMMKFLNNIEAKNCYKEVIKEVCEIK